MDTSFHHLNQLAFGYWKSQVLFVLSSSAICDHLGTEGRTLDEIVDQLSGHRDNTEALLNAAVGLRLLRLSDGVYQHTELSRRFLTANSPEQMLHWLRIMAHWVTPWSQMGAIVKQPGPVECQSGRLGEDAEQTRNFILAMHEFARTHAERFAEDMAGLWKDQPPNLLVDVGGGAGTYTLALCRRLPHLRAVILDLDSVLPLAQELIEDAGLGTRVSTAAIDYRQDPFWPHAPSSWKETRRNVDVVLLSNVLHQESRSVGQDMLRRAHAALRKGGHVVVQGHFLNEDRLTPTFTTLHNLSARALWSGGHSYTLSSMESLLSEAGFSQIRTFQAGAQTRFLATKSEV